VLLPRGDGGRRRQELGGLARPRVVQAHVVDEVLVLGEGGEACGALQEGGGRWRGREEAGARLLVRRRRD
jgi:hypothetical protein